MSNIRILVSAHKDVYVPKNQLLQRVQAGTALAEKKLQGMLHDDEGEQISEKNKAYCELTVQYWAWKNLKADYYGFFHYRRYMDFSREYPLGKNGKLPVRKWKPYEDAASIRKNLSVYGLDEKNMRKTIESYDVITVLSERMNVTVYQQYGQFHNSSDLDKVIEIVKRRYPQYAKACDWYMNSKYVYFCNMYIMKKTYFFSYMAWLFPILEEFESGKDFSHYSEQELRAPAFLAERLFGVYYTQLKRRKKVKCCELGYVIFQDTQPEAVIKPYFAKSSMCHSVNLVSAANQLFVPYLGVMLYSVIAHARDERNYDIVILHTDICIEYRDMIVELANAKPNIQIRFCDVTDYLKGRKLPVHHHLSEETYFRYFILSCMPDYEKVLWMDADLVVLQDIGELYDTNIQGFSVAAVRDLDVIGSYKKDPRVKRYIDLKLDIKQPYDYFQAGVMLLNLKEIRKRYTADDLIRMTLKDSWRMLDQDVLNWALQGTCLELPQKWNVVMDWHYCGKHRMDLLKQVPFALWEQYQTARKEPAVIHYAGGRKPWMVPDCDFSRCFWEYARQSPFYEMILYSRVPDARFRLNRNNDFRRVFRLSPTNFTVAVDMRKINKIFPAGSLRRRAVRMICGKFL